MTRQIIGFAVSAALVLTPLSAMAGDDSQQSSQSVLAPGPAAGLKNAQDIELGTTGWVAIGIAAAALIVGIASSGGGGGGGGSIVTTTTTGTS